ncbi:nesprin-2 [Anableps anableps]
MSSDFYSSDGLLEKGSVPLDIDNIHMLLQVEQEQIQKRTFTNWVNAQLAKRRPPSMIVDLFSDFRDGSKLLDLLEVMSGQRINRDKGRGMFQNRSNIEKALSFLKKKSIKLVNINIPDIIDGKPSIILGLIWMIILQYHIEELASCLSFDSRQSSIESLASLDTCSTLSSHSASSSPVPPKGSPLHSRFRVSAKKALLLWVREQCHRVGCSISIKDFKATWRSGVVFLAILNALRPNLVDLSKARTRSNKQNLEEAFHIAETELRIPRLLDPNDVDVRDPDEKSIMTYVAQFLQYSREVPAQEEEMLTQYLTPRKSPSPVNLPVHYTPAISASPLRQATPDRKAQEVTCWLVQAYDELLEGWDSTEGESYSERYHVFQTFLVSFNEQRQPIMPLLTAMRRTPKLSEEQRALREAWDSLSEKLREYKVELDTSLPAPLDTVARWLLKMEGALAEEQGDPQDHSCAADEAREKQELLKICLEEMPQHLKLFQSFHNLDEFGNTMVPSDKIDELKRRFTSMRVTAKYHGIKLEYREHRHTVLDLLGQIRAKLCIWKRPYISPEAVRVLLHEWDEMNKQELPSLLEAALRKLKQISEKYSSKSALAADYHHVSQQVKQLEENTAVVLEELSSAKILMGRVLSAWDSYNDCLSSLQAWLEQGSVMHNHGNTSMVTSESMSEWGSRHAHLNEVGNFLMESTDPQTSRGLAEELRKLNKHWAEFVRGNTLENTTEPSADISASSHDLQYLIREATLILKEPLEAMAGPLRAYRKQLQVIQTLLEAEQVCAELQHSVSGLDTRLAELLLWEMEARELYELLSATDRQQKLQGQDPRARVIISRGLQLEGQVVTEEQDLQVIVMTSQKTTPIQYLHASAMQKRVQNAVAQSQQISSQPTHSQVLYPVTEIKSMSPQQPKPLAQAELDLPAGFELPAQPKIQLESLDLFTKTSSPDQAPSQAYTEAYEKAQALARNHFEEAKHCLQGHIMEAISVFKDKCLPAVQASVEETLQTLDPELLEEFLRATKGMEAFCTQSQLKEMKLFTQSVQSQWEACFSADFAKAGQHLEALKELCGTLSPEDAHRLAQTQLVECEKKLAAIQHQFSGDQDSPQPDSRIYQGLGEDVSTQKGSKKPSDKLQVSPEMPQVTVQRTSEEKTDIEKQVSVEEITKKEALERYETCKRTLQAHLAKNEQNFREVPSDFISLKGLHTRLQEIQFLRQETELLWSEYANQCSHYSKLSGDSLLEQEKAELLELWRSQQTDLQRRGSSLGAALRQIDSTENHMVDFNERLNRYLRQSKDITGFTLANTNILKDIKELHDNIQSELDQLSRLDPESSGDLDPRECFPLTREVETHKASLDQLRQQVQKSEAAARALDRFLISLRKVDDDISGVQGAPCSDSLVLQDCCSKLSLIRQSIDSLKEKAPQLDLLLQGARLTVTRDGSPASCLDMVAVLLRRLEEADSGLASQQKGIQKETQSKSFGLRKRIALGELRKLQDDGEENLLQDLETQWEETQRAFFDRKKQCNVLLELLKKFQTCRSYLSTTIQKAEQTISDQASYIGKDNLQRSMAMVCETKEELAGLGEKMEEMKGACRQLQSDLKKFPDCTETPFEIEADTLMDNWLDITEKTDVYMDNLRVGLELWEKQLMFGGEVDSWAGAKLALFSEGNPFSNEQQVLAMRDEIQRNEKNIEHFHKKSTEIQEMLLSQEAPLELQVMESQLRKKMEQVKELFSDCTDVFQEIIAVRKHLSEKIKECWTVVENIQNCLSTIEDSDPKAEAQIQGLHADLNSQEEQAEAVLKEVGLVSSVASPQVLEELSADCSRLREAITHTKDMIHLKREEKDKGLYKVINDERELFEEWFQDLQLSVNECFESPESRSDVETSVQRLTAFLKSEDTERRLNQLNDQLERARQQVPPQQLSELINWLKEQQEEVATFSTHCQNRQEQMESLLDDLNCLQKEHESLCEWLQNKEKQSVVAENVKILFKELQDERQGVRAESILKDGDNLLQRYRNLETRLQKQAAAQSVLDEEYNKFKAQAESTRTWISDLSQPLTSPGKDTDMEEMKRKALVNNLRRRAQTVCDHQDADEDQKVQTQKTVKDTEKQWRKVFQTAQQVEAAAAAEIAQETERRRLEVSNNNWCPWAAKLNLRTDFVQHREGAGGHEISVYTRAQLLTFPSSAVLCPTEWPDISRKLRRKRRRTSVDIGHCSRGRKYRPIIPSIIMGHEKRYRWRVDGQVSTDRIHGAFNTFQPEILRDKLELSGVYHHISQWIPDYLTGHPECVRTQDCVSDRLVIMSSKAEGDSKLQKLRSLFQSVYSQNLGEQKKQDIQQRLRDSEEQWAKLLKNAKQAMSEAERQHALDLQLRNFEALKDSISSWIKGRQEALASLDYETDLEQVIKTAQNILSLKPEGDSKLSELTRQSQSLSEQEKILEHAWQETQKVVQDSKELWGKVLETAENTLVKAEVHYLLSREMGAFRTHAGNTKSWIEDLQKQADSIQGGMQGSKAQLEEQMKTVQTILSSKSNGESQVTELKRRAQSLCDHTDLEEDKKVEVKQTVQDAETQWMTVVQAAQETQRQLQGVMERLLSCKYQQDQAEAHLAEIQKQASNLPQIFPWPGLGERRQAVEQARTLLDQSTTLASVLSDVRAQDVVANLERGIVMERQCTLLIEQHEAAQDWLREQVKGLGPPPADRHGLHNAVNTLKALLQTVDREQREMMELDSAKDCLLSLCTPGGQDAISLEISHLHELCANSEQEVKERLTTCERRLEEMGCELAQISQGLKERAAALQWELRSLDQAFSYSEPQNNIAQLQQHWHSLQNCENSLLDLGVKVHDLYQEVGSSTEEMQTESLQMVEKSSSDVAPGEVTHWQELSAQEHGTLHTQKPDLKQSERSAIDNVFTEIQQLSGTGIISQLIEKNVPEDLIIPTSDLDLQLYRLASTVLRIKSSPTDLNPKAMAQQVEEVQQGLGLAQLQISMPPQLREADPERGEVLEEHKDQWVAMAQDAAAVIQIKEAQLQLVADYCRHRATAKTMMDQLIAEVDAMKISNPIVEKMITVMRDGLAWAKQTESDIEGRRKWVPLLPEEVHRQLRDLKKLQSEVIAKQGQLESLVEEVTELLPQLDQAKEVPIVHTSLARLEELSKSTTDKLSKAIKEVEKASAVLEKVEAELPDASEMKVSTEELQELLQSWEQYQERLDCEHRALSALELRTARLLGVPAHLEQAPPFQLCQHLQLMQGQYASVGQKSKEGLLGARLELEEREKIREELQVICVWLEDAEGVLTKMEQCSSMQELQELYSQLCAHKALLQHIMESLKRKYAVVPVEIDSQLQEVTKSLHYVEAKVAEAVERSGPVHRLGTKLSGVQVGLRSVQNRMKERSSTVTEAKITQKRVWDELDVWHSRLAALEVEMQDLEKPEEALILTEKLVEVQQLHSQVAKQAEQRTTLLSKIHTWLQEHQEMIKSSKCWMTEAQSWLVAPCIYTTAKCLSSHVHALQIVLGDASQIRSMLQNFSSVLREMSQVCDVTALQDQLLEADHRVAEVQDSFTAPLSQLEHAAAEVEAIENEVHQMENDVAEIKTLLSSPETLPSPREDNLKMIEQKIQSMRRTVAEIQKCKPGLCLPEKAEETLTVFNVVEQLQTLLLDLEKKVPALFIQQPSTPSQAKVTPKLPKSTSENEEMGQITVVHFEEDILKRSGGTLQTVKPSSPEQRHSSNPDSIQGPEGVVSEAKEVVTVQGTDQTAEDGKDVESSTDTTEASSSEALSKPLGTVRTQSLSESIVNTASTVNVSRPDSRPQQRCLSWPAIYRSSTCSLRPPSSVSLLLDPWLPAPERVDGVENREIRKAGQVDVRQADNEAERKLEGSLGIWVAGPRPNEGILNACLERAGRLEAWLLEAQRSLVAAGTACSSAMQNSVELQLLTCQEMFLEIEGKVAVLSSLTFVPEQQQPNELGAVGSQKEVAELLASKLELLKANLVSFQQLLQDRHGEETVTSDRQMLEQKPVLEADHHPGSQLKSTSSIQEIFSSPKNKPLRQSSLQQQKELEQELCEQRGLTQAIFRQGSRVRLYSQEPEDYCELRLSPAEGDVEEDSAQKKWDCLHSRLLALEGRWMLPSSEVTDSSMKGGDGTAGRMIGTKHLKELQNPISHLRQLGHTFAELSNQAYSVDNHQVLDEGLFHVLHSAYLSLSSIHNLLDLPAGSGTPHEEETQLLLLQLQSLSADLATLGSELVTQGSKFSHVLGSECSQQCVDDLCRLLPVVQASLTQRQKQVVSLQQDTADKQKHLKELHSDFTINKLNARRLTEEIKEAPGLNEHLQAGVQMQESLQQQAEQVTSLNEAADQHTLPASFVHQATQLQSELDSVLGDVRSHCTELKSCISLHQQYEWLFHSMNQLLSLGSERTDQHPEMELHSRTQLQQRSHTHMMWTQWEEQSIWSESVLRNIETSFPKMKEGSDYEEKDLRQVLEENKVRFSQMLESGHRLKEAGCGGVGLCTFNLEARWESLQKSLEHEQTSWERKKKLRKSLSCSEKAAISLICLTETWLTVLTPDSHINMYGFQQTEEAPLCGKRSVLLMERTSKLWMDGLTQQEALQELQAWLGAAESHLEKHKNRIKQDVNTNVDLSRILKYCKDCQIEVSAHQATLQYFSQPLQSADNEQRRRYEYNQDAEQQGYLNHQLLGLLNDLNVLIHEVEQDLRDRLEWDTRLKQINIWIINQNLWIHSAQTPSSQTELQRSISWCENLEEKIQQMCTALQELRKKICAHKEKSSSDRVSQTDTLIQACDALTQQNESSKQRLIQAQQLWSSLEMKQIQVILKTIRASQTLDYCSSPQLTLQGQKHLHEKLQFLLKETQAYETDWDDMGQTVSSLRELISPAAAAVITDWLEKQSDSWTQVLGAVNQQLQKSRDVLLLWEAYNQLKGSLSDRLQLLQSDSTSELSLLTGQDNTVEQIAVMVTNVESLLNRANTLLCDLGQVLEVSKDLVVYLEPLAASLVQSESRLLSRSILQLSQQVSARRAHLQEELKQLQDFENELEFLERTLEDWQRRLESRTHTDQSGLLEPSGLSADLDVLNEQSCSLSASGAAAQRLQHLNHCWAQTATTAEEACSELQTEELRQQSFEAMCESWMTFLQRMEDNLAVDIAGSYSGLRQQLCTHKRFQAELVIGHQILHSVITEALHLLQKGEVEDRSDFILKLAQLREHWQGAVQRADQRRSLVECLVRHWHFYTRSLRKLQRFLSDTQNLIPLAGQSRCSLPQLRRSLQDLQHTELLFQRYQSTFIHTLEVGRQLFYMGDQETQSQLQLDLGTLQEEWENLHNLLAKRMELIETIIKNWDRCVAGIADSMLQLKEMKTRLNQSMPDCDADLQSAENEDSLEDWAESLTELSTMKTDLSQYIIADDVLLLQEQVEHLHCQWEELCFKVSLRKQEIADRLSAWIIFNEKNKELCEWLTQMENKVAHSSDLNIEEMVEKLKKDCMEEINLFSENKTHLKQLGEQLITASNKTKETEVNVKLKDINGRWQHLFNHIEARVRKLKETLVTVQQLDKNMSNLRTWLSCIEAELAKPVVYNVCHSEEIHKKLTEQQDLQRDIEQHTESVASVLTLCDILLHDADACGSDSKNDSIQQTTRSLDRRWKNICAMSMERRMRIEETWRLWCKFLDDYSRFEDWLKTAEVTAANPDSSNVLYTCAKEELKKFEAFQRQVHERLTQLELVNKQYRRLARENRTDAACKLKLLVHDGNQRWDFLQRRVAAILRRLKHFTSQREDFEGTREGILVWLTEMDLQLTDVEHFSGSDIEDKMRQLRGFKQEITLNTNKIDALIVFGENLIQKSAPLDAVLIEDELVELHSYCQEVFGRVARFHHRLINRRPVLDEDREISDHEADLDQSSNVANRNSWTEERRKKEESEAPALDGVSAGQQAMTHLLVPPPERSGRETPVSVDSIPLEWDHTVDVGGSSSHEDEEDPPFFSVLSVKSVMEQPSWHQPSSPERKRVPREIIRGLSTTPTHNSSSSFHHARYAKFMSDCSGSINSVKRVKLILNDDQEVEEAGLTSSTAIKQTSTGVIERWELQEAQRLAGEGNVTNDLKHWHKLNSDLCDVTSWLGRVLPELERLQRIVPSTSIRDIEVNIKKLKEMRRTFNSYKCLMISVNLSSHYFLWANSAELQELQEALNSANHSWTQACNALESWERKLHSALLQCQEFHEALQSLLLLLSQAESKLHAVNIFKQSIPQSSLLQQQHMLMALQEELRGRHRQVLALQEISSQLLLEATSEEGVEAKEKVCVIGNKLHLLLREVVAALCSLQEMVETCSTGSEAPSLPLLPPKVEAGLQAATPIRRERRDLSPHRPLLYRVIRAAFPLYLLFLVLLVLVCLVPLSDEDNSCTLSNNFARSFYPMLRYINGPPPT